MSSIVVVFPKIEDAKHVRDLLSRHGMNVVAACNTAAMALSQISQLDAGIVICSSKVRDMHYTQLAEYLPDFFDMLLLASSADAESYPLGGVVLTYPLKTHELIGAAEMMLSQIERRLRKRKIRPERDQNYINNAKAFLMERKHLTEQEAFRYIQKCSMDSATNMVEMAQMLLRLMYEE